MKRLQVRKINSWAFFLLVLGWSVISFSCSSDGNKEESSSSKPATTAQESASDAPEHGVGPVEEVEVGEGIDQAMAERGQEIFESKCSACHKFNDRYVGPPMAGVTERRNHAWIMNMIINPQEMTKKDPIAKKLLSEYMTQMVAQDVDREDARALLEYFRQEDSDN